MRYALLFLLVLLPVLALAQRERDPREEILTLINAERREAGAPPLRFSSPLAQVAQWHADQISRRGSLDLPPGTTEAIGARIRKAGYESHEWIESLHSSLGGPESLLRSWRRNDPQTFKRLMDPQVRDLGIGLDRLSVMRLYVFLYAVPAEDDFTRRTADLRDLETIRARMLAAVNAARKQAGVRPLKPDSRLDLAAQRHAEDMLVRGYFNHPSPEGKTVRERARESGYIWQFIGENIAEGQYSVREVMETWMNSPGHRRNILSPNFEDLGAGLALGRSGRTDNYRVVWAQTFGAK